MNNAEKDAMIAFKECEGELIWVKPKTRGFWLYIHSYNGKLFEYVPEEENAENTDCMVELQLCPGGGST